MTPRRLAWLSVTREPLRASLAIVAIGVSVAIAGCLLRLYHLSGARFSTMAHGADAVVAAKADGIDILLGSLNLEGPPKAMLPYRLYASLRARQTVRFEDGAVFSPELLDNVVPLLYAGRYERYWALGTDDNFRRLVELAEGRWPEANEEVVLGADVPGAEGRLALTLKEGSAAVRVVGHLKRTGTAWDRGLYLTLPFAQTLVGPAPWKEGGVHYFLVSVKEGGFESLQQLINGRTVGQAVDVAEETHRLESLTGRGGAVGLGVTALVLLMAALTAASLLLARFDAMAVHVAVLRALGWSRRQIGFWLVGEACFVGAAACAGGALLDALLFPVGRWLLGSSLPPPEVAASPWYFSAPVWAAAMVAVGFAGLLPLWLLFRQDVHAALRRL